jgi:hypothetical protein
MIKLLKSAAFFIIPFLILQGASGQMPENMTDYLSRRFLSYCKSVPREEIFIHTDREEYISGEDLWFKIYLIDRQSFKPSLKSRIAYFELLNAENKPIVQKRILTEKGVGPGQIVLPDTISSGTYTIRAYTNWMKNFLPYNCFMKDIKIYNALNSNKFRDKLIPAEITNREVTSQNNSEENSSGVTLKVNNLRPDTLEVYLTADFNIRSENNNLFYIFIQTHGNINIAKTEKITGETTKMTFPKDLLSQGVNQITIFNSKGEPVSERFIYTPVVVNNPLSLHYAGSYQIRDKVILEIEPGGELLSGNYPANLSVSVAQRTTDQEVANINDYLVFGTEYGLLPRYLTGGKKYSELPPEFIDSILLNVRSNWINWKTILSGGPPQNKYQFEKDDHFLTGKLLPIDQQESDSAEFILLCAPGKQADFQSAKTDIEGNFTFNIHINEDLKNLIIMSDDTGNKRKISIESSFSDKYLHSEVFIDSVKKPVPAYISDWSVNYQVRKIYGVSAAGSLLKPVFPPMKPQRFYGKPDIELIMADYISLPRMEEVFFELLPHVSLKKRNSNYIVTISDRVDDNQYVLSPCLLIDGVIIKDPSMIVDLDPEIVEKIDVIKEKYVVADYSFSGIVNIITKSGDFSCVPLPDYMITLPYRVIDPLKSFYAPDYSSEVMKENPVPDFRNTLYWNPSVIPDKEGKIRIKFWTSDIVSDYEINIQGITLEGKPISAKKLIRVE